MRVNVDSYWYKGHDYSMNFGIYLIHHKHCDYCPWHFHFIIDLFAWYVQFTVGKEDPDEKTIMEIEDEE